MSNIEKYLHYLSKHCENYYFYNKELNTYIINCFYIKEAMFCLKQNHLFHNYYYERVCSIDFAQNILKLKALNHFTTSLPLSKEQNTPLVEVQDEIEKILRTAILTFLEENIKSSDIERRQNYYKSQASCKLRAIING